MPSILSCAPVPPAAKHPTTWCCHHRASRLGWCSPPFSSKHNDGHYANSSIFVSSDQRTKYDLCPPCAVANHILAFLWRFWSSGFFLAERPFRLCRYRTCFTVDIDTFVPVSSSIFTRSFAVVLGLICTFRTDVHTSIGDRTLIITKCLLSVVSLSSLPPLSWRWRPVMTVICPLH